MYSLNKVLLDCESLLYPIAAIAREKTKVKLIHVIFISLSIMAYGMPIQALGQVESQIFSLPDVRTGEACNINILTVLRDKYRLRLETNSRSYIFRWTLNGGELPPGLVLRPSGAVSGTPRVGRAQPYNFQVKVTAPNAEALILDLSLNVMAPQIRLVQVSALKLVPLETPEGRVSAPSSNGTLHARANGRVKVNLPETALNETTRESPTVSTSRTDSPTIIGAADSDVRTSMMRPQALPTPPCNISRTPEPSATPGPGVFYLDARNGNLSENRRLVTSPRRFKRHERAVIVVDNKNPYLYTYKLTIQATPVLEPALDAFVPLIVGSLGEFKPKAPPSGAPSGQSIADADPCKPAKEKVRSLLSDVETAVGDMSVASGTVGVQRTNSRNLTDAYNAARLPLFTPNQTRENLYTASKDFIRAVDSRIGLPNGVDRATLDTLGAEIERLRRVATTFKTRVEAIRAAHPNCLNESDGGELISEQLRRATEEADELLANAASYERALNEIRTDLQRVIDARTSVLRVLCDPHAFFSESVVGQFEETNDVDIQLEVTPRQGVTEAQPISGSPFRTKFTFGNAPFFSISGGLIFSPLRKQEFVRVQGFELDAQGNQVLVNGKPNLTTVIGLKESSPTRIIPAVFLNGLLTERKTGFIDGVHLSLGITAKNDNKGTDVEFLVGPSLSMLERRMFFTFGGYAGKQQKLAGDLFEGLALPSGVSEIPVEKNYRWHVGFALSYRIPVTK